jgi:hypothetical protein
VISSQAFEALVEEEFAWLLERGFRVVHLQSFGYSGHMLRLAHPRCWLELEYERRDSLVTLSWGTVLGPGMFYDDPYRNPLPVSDLLSGVSAAEVAAAGACEGPEREALSTALHRMSGLVRENGSERLEGQ